MAGVWPDARLRSPDPIGPTQGRLLCTQLAPHKQVYSHSVIHISVPPTGSPRRWVDVPHAVAGRPSTLTPSISPRLGVVSQHQKLHRYALCGFLGPPSGSTVPTRILRHRVYSIHETFFNFKQPSGCSGAAVLSCGCSALHHGHRPPQIRRFLRPSGCSGAAVLSCGCSALHHGHRPPQIRRFLRPSGCFAYDTASVHFLLPLHGRIGALSFDTVFSLC